MEQYINKSAVKAKIENLVNTYKKCPTRNSYEERLKDGRLIGYKDALYKISTLEVKEVDITSMADDYYDALMKEAADWMDEGTIGHCRLAYYTGCKDVLAKLQKGE